MTQATKGKRNNRCPSCFMGDIDLFFNETKGEYYCRFTGKEGDVLRRSEAGGFRCRAMNMQMVAFGKDNSPLASYTTREVSNDTGN